MVIVVRSVADYTMQWQNADAYNCFVRESEGNFTGIAPAVRNLYMVTRGIAMEFGQQQYKDSMTPIRSFHIMKGSLLPGTLADRSVQFSRMPSMPSATRA